MDKYKKYLLVAKNTFDEFSTYRVSFLMWRVRTIIGFFSVYFIWLIAIPSGKSIGSYTHTAILSYVFLSSFLASVVQSSRSYAIGDEINNGNLSNFLIRPINYFLYWFAKDLGDKGMNIVLSIIELSFLYFLLRPDFFVQQNIFYIFLFLLMTGIGVVIYFFINVVFGTVGFWSQDTWAPRFLLYATMSFFSGGLFPLDLLPKNYYVVLSNLPFAFLYYVPIKIYLGQLTGFELLGRIAVGVGWAVGLYVLSQYLWQKGLKLYTAAGR